MSIPALIENFEGEVQTYPHGTLAKLKIFFVGETGDRRTFTLKFAEELVKTLPGTLVVTYYDKETEDFKGHNGEQYVYGIVPYDAKASFETDEAGTKWATTPVVLFTERDDNIGEIARKIVGKSQSLELNPDTVEYEMIIKNNIVTNIVFTKGSFYGLSVLGDNQTPAFKGSEFFTTNEFKDIFNSFTKDTTVLSEGGIDEMNKGRYEAFLDLSNNTKLAAIDGAITVLFESYDFYLADLYEDRVIVRNYGALNKEPEKFGRYFMMEYSITEDFIVTFGGEPTEVYMTYLPVEQTEGEGFTAVEEPISEPEEQTTGIQDLEDSNSSIAEETFVDDGSEANLPIAEEPAEDAVVVVDATETNNSIEDNANSDNGENDGFQNQEKEEKPEGVNFAALTDTERAELEAFRQEKKFNLINSFADLIESEKLEQFKQDINSYTYDDLNSKLCICYVEKQKKEVRSASSFTSQLNPLGFIFPTDTGASSKTEIARLIEQNKDK